VAEKEGAVRLITEPTVLVVASMALDTEGMNQLLDWVRDYRPECVPTDLPADAEDRAMALFPHGGKEAARALTDNELLVELAGRSCYHSYGLRAGRKSNVEYVRHMLFPAEAGSLPHASTAYHAKMTFFIAGVSRRVSHELIRHYVGADRTEEGSPSQESTRYTFHPGHFAVPPYYVEHDLLDPYEKHCQAFYDAYRRFITGRTTAFFEAHGRSPVGIERKRIYEAAAGLLPMQACTSFLWTTNPIALNKLFAERCSPAADGEFQRLARKWQEVARARWPALFPPAPVGQ